MLRLKELREKRRISQTEFAQIIGISRQTLWNYENNVSEPGIDNLAKIAIILNVTIDELIGFRDDYEKLHEELLNKIQQKEKEPKS